MLDNYQLGEYIYNKDIIKNRVILYNRSPKGKQKRKEWKEKNKERMKEWYKKYRERKIEMAKKYNLCLTCYKRPVIEGRNYCDFCLNRRRNYAIKNVVK